MTTETAVPIRVSLETPEVREKRTGSTIACYARVETEEPTWDDIGKELHEQTFNPLFATLDERGMVRAGMVALFFGSHEGHDVRFFKRFVDEREYHDVGILALEIADRYSKEVRGWDSFCKVEGVQYIHEDALQSGLPSQSVDLIVDRLSVMYTCFRYFPSSGPQALAEAHRILRPDGHLILDGGRLMKVQGIGTHGSTASQIKEFHPELFQQMEDGFVHLVDPTNNQDYRFEVGKFNVPGIPSQWGQFELWDGNERTDKWLHYQFTKL